MDIPFNEMLDKVTSFIKDEANTKTVIGEPFTLGEFSCIPVIRVGLGFGTGGGEGEEGGSGNKKGGHGGGGGAGAGMGIEPIGFLASRGDQISFIPSKQNSGLSAAFEKVPDLISKYMDMKKEEEASA
jgi:uncharacterized spore protein YtfJ